MPSSCCAYGCTMRGGTNKLSKVKFFTFPTCMERRKAWISAVRRENWQPSKSSVLCNLHFVTGKPSKDPAHPDWIPSLFVYQPKSLKNKHEKLARYNRMKAREVRVLKERQQECPEPMEVVESNENEDPLPAVRCQWVQTDMTGADIDELIFTNDRRKKQELEAGNTSIHFPSSNIETDKVKLKFFTNLPSFTLFSGLLTYIVSKWTPPSINGLTYMDQLLLTLMKLRLGLLNTDLAYRFGISKKQVTKVFDSWMAILVTELKPLIIWPTKESLKKSLPSVFKNENVKNVRCIIDCTEIFLQRPSNLTRRSQTYSNYKHHNTVKILVGITPNGSICFLSKCYGGRISDKELTMKSSFLNFVMPGDTILADRGFLIRDLLASKQVKLFVPAFTRGKPQLSRKEVENSRQLSRLRIHVERVIAQLKTFRILQGTVPISLLKKCDNNSCMMDYILIVCSSILNMLDPIVS